MLTMCPSDDKLFYLFPHRLLIHDGLKVLV